MPNEGQGLRGYPLTGVTVGTGPVDPTVPARNETATYAVDEPPRYIENEHYSKDRHRIEITEVDNGFLVHVGCKTIVIEGDHAKMVEILKLYYDDRKKAMMRYLRK